MGGETGFDATVPCICGVCQKVPERVMESSCCFSIFCKECIQGTECPQCRSKARRLHVRPNIPLQRLVDNYWKTHDRDQPSPSILCPKCSEVTSIQSLPKHIEEECSQTLIACLCIGCEETVPRCEMNLHMDKAMKSHTGHLLQTVKKMSKEIEDLNEKLKPVPQKVFSLESLFSSFESYLDGSRNDKPRADTFNLMYLWFFGLFVHCMQGISRFHRSKFLPPSFYMSIFIYCMLMAYFFFFQRILNKSSFFIRSIVSTYFFGVFYVLSQLITS